jgi:hypothetical protein
MDPVWKVTHDIGVDNLKLRVRGDDDDDDDDDDGGGGGDDDDDDDILDDDVTPGPGCGALVVVGEHPGPRGHHCRLLHCHGGGDAAGGTPAASQHLGRDPTRGGKDSIPPDMRIASFHPTGYVIRIGSVLLDYGGDAAGRAISRKPAPRKKSPRRGKDSIPPATGIKTVCQGRGLMRQHPGMDIIPFAAAGALSGVRHRVISK